MIEPCGERCGAFDTATGETCVMETDHGGRHVLASDVPGLLREMRVMAHALALISTTEPLGSQAQRLAAKALADAAAMPAMPA